MKKPELLAPAGNFKKLRTAIEFGADAVYIGGSKLNLRAFADNFTNEELIEAVQYTHERGKKIYVTLNIIPHNSDFNGLEEYLVSLYDAKVDGIIVADPGIIMVAREVVPDIEIHLSTQANAVNTKSSIFWHKQGVKRIVLAREMSMKEISELRKELPESCELEAFVHGSMCMSYSGRCLISNYMTGRDSNRGACAQPCRYKYHLVEEKRPGEYYEITEDENGTYFFNSKDLCMIEHIPELVEAGINSFKIEGRMKSPFYVASVVKAYRQAIDAYFESTWDYKVDKNLLEHLVKTSHRPFTTGFYFDKDNLQHYDFGSYIRGWDIVGVVESYDKENKIATVMQKNKVLNGDVVEILAPKGENKVVTLNCMKNDKGETIESAPTAEMIFTFKSEEELFEGNMLIKKK